jgi:hypothetical protein
MNVYLKQPAFHELDFVQWLWADHETMQDVGGPVALEDHRKAAWYEKVVQPAGGRHFYCLIYNK